MGAVFEVGQRAPERPVEGGAGVTMRVVARERSVEGAGMRTEEAERNEEPLPDAAGAGGAEGVGLE
ncbi:MAG: hypothetical protein QF903_07505 [Planctomycetota bacterium]|nr:hypothetical protein [Planctomycetota bacterium]MDP6761532.1 hypothetical protein [Planctomycetota bacterium]MDP6989312.1 hypothetical protein [Planctomycetota bacterium]